MAAPNPNFKFAANISTMFKNLPLLERFEAAKKKGFKFVEADFLYEYHPGTLRNAKMSSGLEMVLINSPAGDYATFGMASRPGDEVSFIKSIEKSIFYAVATDCKKVHILAGTRRSGYDEEDLFKIYVKNLKVALEMLEKQNISAVIEPICNEVKENYFLDSFATALKAIEIIQNKNLELLLNFYHLHMIGLTPEESLPLCFKSTGHIHVSQAPHRNEPSAAGWIDYTKVFTLLKEYNYKGTIGLNYRPSDPIKGFQWLQKYGF